MASQKFSKLLESGKYSDLTVTCRSRSWRLHKSVVCTHSDFFASACDGPFKESLTNTIDLSDDDEHALAAMIHFVYHNTYDASVLPKDEHPMLLHIQVFALARKYFIQPLEELAQKNTLEALKEWDSIVFAQAVKEIYALTAHASEGSELRAATTYIVRKNAEKLFGPGCQPHHYLMQDIFEATPGFLSDLATAMAARTRHHAGQFERLQSARRDDRAQRDLLLRSKNEQKDLLEKIRVDLSATEADLVRTRAELSSTKTQLSATKTQLGRAKSDASKLRVETPEQPKYHMPFVPRYTGGQGGSDMKWYLCPNCNTVFSRCIHPCFEYIHPCYSASWVGDMGTSTVRMNGVEWSKYFCFLSNNGS